MTTISVCSTGTALSGAAESPPQPATNATRRATAHEATLEAVPREAMRVVCITPRVPGQVSPARDTGSITRALGLNQAVAHFIPTEPIIPDQTGALRVPPAEPGWPGC